MTPAVEIAEWLRSNHQPDKAIVYADRRPVEFGTDDAVVVHLEEQRDSYLLGGGLGYRGGGESEIRIGLWWIVNPRRDVAQRTPDRALNGLRPLYEALIAVRRTTIGEMAVRFVSNGMGPILREVEAKAEIVAYARVTIAVQRG